MEEGIEHRFKQKIIEMTSVEHLIKPGQDKAIYLESNSTHHRCIPFTQFTKAHAKRLQLRTRGSVFTFIGYSRKGRKLLNQYKKELTITPYLLHPKGSPLHAGLGH